MDPKITCGKCGESVSFKDLRAEKSGKEWICLTCYNKQHSKQINEGKVLQRLKELKKQEQTKTPLINLKCLACGYKYEGSEETLKKMCPYCGKKGAVEKIKSADAFVREAIDF